MDTKIASRSTPPGRRSQEARSDATQKRIIASAMRLLEKKGFKAANLTDIARGAKVTLGALQHHFASRQALMERLIDEVMAPLRDHGEVWPDPALPIGQRAEAFVQRAWETMYGAPKYIAAWSLFFGCKASPDLFARIDTARKHSDPVYFERFLSFFPEVSAHHPAPHHFASFVFTSLRGMGVFNLFEVDPDEVSGQLAVLSQCIAQAGTAFIR